MNYYIIEVINLVLFCFFLLSEIMTCNKAIVFFVIFFIMCIFEIMLIMYKKIKKEDLSDVKMLIIVKLIFFLCFIVQKFVLSVIQ